MRDWAGLNVISTIVIKNIQALILSLDMAFFQTKKKNLKNQTKQCQTIPGYFTSLLDIFNSFR